MKGMMKNKMLNKLEEMKKVEGEFRSEEFNESLDNMTEAIEEENWGEAFSHYEELKELQEEYKSNE